MVISLFSFNSCKNKEKVKPFDIQFTDFESSTQEQTGGILTDKESFSGNKSVLLTKKKAFALSNKFTTSDKDEYYEISVWRKDISGKSALVIQGKSAKDFYKAEKKATEFNDSGWEKIVIKITVPKIIEEVQIYAWIGEADTAYFDDLEIKRYYSKPEKEDNKLSKENSKLLTEQIFYDIDNQVPKADKNKISTKYAFSGKKSILISKKRPFALASKFKSVTKDEYFVVSVWRKGPSKKTALVVAGDKAHSLYAIAKGSHYPMSNGWEKLELKVQVPPNINTISVYVWVAEGDSSYFDDLRISRYKYKEYPKYAKDEKLHLYFTEKKMQKFEKTRYNAFERGVLINDGKWIKGIISDESNVMPIKARLKGDWLDHLFGKKWSFRVKMRDDYTFNRLLVFSLQNPITRYYLNEYITHQLCDQEDILTTRYGFTPLYINGTSLGVYAWEEHFKKQLLEFNMRREGPIMKFDEAPFWHIQQYQVIKHKWLHLPYYHTSKAIAFGMSKIQAKESLKNQFHIAQSLMYQYKNNEANINEIFNLDALAKYWALVDVANGRHGKAWHNQRMYYNPILCKLEPINYDDYTDHFYKSPPADISALLVGQRDTISADKQTLYSVFSSTEFVKLYLKYLLKFSDPEFLTNFINSQSTDIKKYEALLQKEFPDYRFNYNYLQKGAASIRKMIPELQKKINEGYYDDIKPFVNAPIVGKNYEKDALPDYINSYYYKSNKQASLNIENFTGLDIEIIGLANEDKKIISYLENKVILKPFGKENSKKDLTTEYKKKAIYLVFQAKGHSDILYSNLSLWQKNTSLSPYQKLLKANNLEKIDWIKTKGDSLYIEKGNYTLDTKIIIPEGKKVYFDAGVSIDFIKQAAFISHSPVFMNGTEQEPIKIYSSDRTANAFTLLQAKGRSILKHTSFSNFNTFSYEGWTLSGAVIFYESDVDIDYCSFENNLCEDALNIVRSDFSVTHSIFKGIYSDAFDSDFSTGMVDNCTFYNVGNDAIDFSTSKITIQNCNIYDISDKGISGGEQSTLIVNNTTIKNCNIGVASKDLSAVELNKVDISSCQYGLVLLRKKPEYGPATIKANQLKLDNCEKNYLVEKKSILYLNKRKIEGNIKNVSKMFY